MVIRPGVRECRVRQVLGMSVPLTSPETIDRTAGIREEGAGSFLEQRRNSRRESHWGRLLERSG